MRVNIKNSVWQEMKAVAKYLTAQMGEKVTVSDFVRSACYNALLLHYTTVDLIESGALEDLEELLEETDYDDDDFEEDDDSEELLIEDRPFVRFRHQDT